jgi:polar amino acid transport system substrate-binding protein
MPTTSRPGRLLGILACTLMLALPAACSSSPKSSSASSSGAAGSGGTIVNCSDVSYPPAEFYQVTLRGTHELTRTLAGADIEIGRAVAKRLGAGADFVNTPFSAIISSLQEKKCDAIISFMNDTAQRRTQLDFVDYLAAGQTTMTKKAAPPIHSLNDLFGKTVAVTRGTTEEDFLDSHNHPPAGQQPIKILAFATDNDATYALSQGAAQVYFGDTPVVTTAVNGNGALTAGAQLVEPIPIGIALMKGDARRDRIKQAIHDMYADGSMATILVKWKLIQYAISPQQ